MTAIRVQIVGVFTALLFAATSATTSNAQTATDDLAAFVSELPRGMLGIPFQWLEMQSAVGWERMMLVFGYADNASVCEGLLKIAKEDSPQRDFRCTPAN